MRAKGETVIVVPPRARARDQVPATRPPISTLGRIHEPEVRPSACSGATIGVRVAMAEQVPVEGRQQAHGGPPLGRRRVGHRPHQRERPGRLPCRQAAPVRQVAGIGGRVGPREPARQLGERRVALAGRLGIDPVVEPHVGRLLVGAVRPPARHAAEPPRAARCARGPGPEVSIGSPRAISASISSARTIWPGVAEDPRGSRRGCARTGRGRARGRGGAWRPWPQPPGRPGR